MGSLVMILSCEAKRYAKLAAENGWMFSRARASRPLVMEK